MVERELDIGQSHGANPVEGLVAGARGGLLEGGSEELEALRHDRADQGAAVGEVVIRRRVAHARAAGDFAQREAVDASLGEELEAGIEEGPPQVAVVVAGSLSSSWNLTLSRCSPNLTTVKIQHHGNGRKESTR